MIKNKLKELLSELKNPKVRTVLVLDCKNRQSKLNYMLEIQTSMKHFKSMHQSNMEKIKDYTCEYLIVFDVKHNFIKRNFEIFEC